MYRSTVDATTRFSPLTHGKGFTLLHNSLHECAGQMTIFIVSAIASQFIFPGATVPFITLAVSLLVTKIVIKLKDTVPQIPLSDILGKAYETNKKYPKIQMISVICSVILSALSPTISLLASAGSGIYLGLVSNNQTKKRNHVPQRNLLNEVGC